uniref:Uncharacterized protein n=1 Tax=viral metagenome TaxID=1070528 RepID=A0A6C0ESS2_9ZZZZ
MYEGFLIVYVILFIGGYYLFYFSSFAFYIKLPLIISFFVIVSYVSYVLGKIWQNPSLEIKETLKRVFSIYGKFLLMMIGVMVICVLLYKILMGTLIFSLSKSLWFTMGLIILILALIKGTFYDQEEDQSEIVSLLKDIIFYIPCLLTDSIEYIKQDYLITPSTTIIVFILIVIYLFFFLIMPKIMNIGDGYSLITDPQKLNENVLSISTDEINSILLKNKSSYDKSIYSATNEFKYNIKDISNVVVAEAPHYPYDELTAKFIGSKDYVKENFTSIQATDANINLNFNKPTIDLSANLQKNPQNFDYYKEIQKNPTVQKVEKGIYNFYSGFEAVRETIFSSPFNKIDYIGPYISSYGLSFWVYFNTLKPLKGIDTIMSFGLKPSLLFDHKHNELIIKATDTSNNSEILYKTKEILFQRWNHFVVNFDDSKLSLFINNNLVGFYNTNPIIQSDDLLTVGSTKNNNVGAVCNFKYYKNPLQLNKIASIYKKYNKKDPPI